MILKIIETVTYHADHTEKGTSNLNEAKQKCSHDIGPIIYMDENRPYEQTASKFCKTEELAEDLPEPLWTLIWEI